MQSAGLSLFPIGLRQGHIAHHTMYKGKGGGSWKGGGMMSAAGYGGGFGKGDPWQGYGQAPMAPAWGKGGGGWGKEAGVWGQGGGDDGWGGKKKSSAQDWDEGSSKKNANTSNFWVGRIEGLDEAVHEALEPHLSLDTTWAPEEAEKRVVQYIMKAAKRYTKDERVVQRATPAQAAALIEEFVHSSMQAVSAGCYDKPWFYEAKFNEVLYIASVGTFTGRKLFARTLAPSLRAYVDQALFGYAEDVRVEKAMREAIETSGVPESYHKKALTYLTKSCEDAQISAPYGTSGPHTGVTEELGILQDFVTGWIRGFVQRSWDVLENGVGGGTEAHIAFVINLFHSVTDPEKCCIPHEMIVGPDSLPPKEWSHVMEIAHIVFTEAQDEGGGPPAKRMRAIADGGQGIRKVANGGALTVARHPQCTNEAACIGSAEQPLVRHVMDDGSQGDIYCKMCWDAVTEVRPSLKCEFVA